MEDYILLKRLHAYSFTLLLSLRVVHRVAVMLAFKSQAIEIQ